MSLTPQALRLLSKEVVTLRNDPPEGIRVVVDEEDLTAMVGWVQGPGGTPYEGGYFRVRFDFGPEYPNLPPKCTMLTRIFHPNVSRSGEICVDTLKKGWDKKYGVGHVLLTIKCLLIHPNPESALDEEAGKQLLADYDGYRKYAELMTSIHATPKVPPPEFRNASSSSSTYTSIPKSTIHASAPAPASASVSRPATSTSATKPAPLQAHAKQEQSPVIDNTDGKLDDPSSTKPLKSGTTSGSVPTTKTPSAGTKAGGASKAKRGLKRL